MEFAECKKALTDYLYQKISQKQEVKSDDVRALIKEVWSNDPKLAAQCHVTLGASSGIRKIILEVMANPEGISESKSVKLVHGSAQDEETTTSVSQDTTDDASNAKIYESEQVDENGNTISQTKTDSNQNNLIALTKKETNGDFWSFIDDGKSFAFGVLDVLMWGAIIIATYMILRYFLAFVYDVVNTFRMTFVKVVLPRGDSKADREREKEIAKDMKEKIGRMAQVFRNFHKLGQTTLLEQIMRVIFDKPKVSMMLHYEGGKMNFIIGVYPEYLKTIEGAISAQYPDASIEACDRPNFYKKKFSEILPMQPTKDTVYPIRVFKQLEDDPINNVIDAIGKISSEDTFSIVMSIKPSNDKFNKRAQAMADGLFKKDMAVINKKGFLKRIFFFWTWFDFLIAGPSQGLLKRFSPGATQGDPFIRMVKAEEEALNIMGEEAGKPAFISGLMLITSSDDKTRLIANRDNVVSAYTIYKDEYNNGLDQPEIMADIFGWLLKPLWRFSTNFFLISFFFRKNIFTVNELASLFHLPDGLFNRSPIITWMDYKSLSTPDGLPTLTQPNEMLITGKVAEMFKGGDISDIFKTSKHWAVGSRVEQKEELIPVSNFSKKELEGKTIIEKNGEQFVKEVKNIRKTGLKVFKDGTLLGVNYYRNVFTPIYMRKKDRSRHHYIIGKSGGGKSVYISSLARQDIWNGEGICVIDPHGDLVEDILEYIPKERAKDVIYFDAGAEDRPMGLNLYEIDSIDQADRVVNDATEIFLKMFGPEIFGPRIQEYFKYGSLTLLEDMEDGATLIDVPRLFTDEIFREYKLRKVKNPVIRNFWERTYAAMGEREKQEIIPYFTSKFVSFITNRLIRNIIGQTKSAFRFREAMDQGKILLVNLSKGKIGEINAQLLGMILVSQIYNAAMSRADIPEDQRKDFYLYVDEFQNFVSGTFSDILSEARKYHLSLIMAHQYMAQLESNAGNNIGEKKSGVKDAVFGNVGTMQSFKVGAPDAEFLEKEYAPVLTAQDIIGISNYKVYIKMNINNATSRVFSMDTIWTEDYKNKKVAQILKEYSSKKYGRKKEFVEAEITARLGMMDEENTEENQDAQVPQEQQSQTS